MEIRVCFVACWGHLQKDKTGDSWTCCSLSPDLSDREPDGNRVGHQGILGGNPVQVWVRVSFFGRPSRRMHWQPSAAWKEQSLVPELDLGLCPVEEEGAGVRRVSALAIKPTASIPPVTMYPQGRHPVSATLSRSLTSSTNGTDEAIGCKRDVSSDFQLHVRILHPGVLKSQLIESCVGGIKHNVCLY